MPEPSISVLLVDDHSLVRRGFRRMLEDEPDMKVVGEASDGHDAIASAAKFKPHVVVMDFALPSMNGAVATRHILKANPEISVLMLSMHAEPNYVRTCLEAGARGYLLKNALDLELVQAVRQIAGGATVLDPRLGRLAEPQDEQVVDHANWKFAIDRAWQVEQGDRDGARLVCEHGERASGEHYAGAGDP